MIGIGIALVVVVSLINQCMGHFLMCGCSCDFTKGALIQVGIGILILSGMYLSLFSTKGL